MEIVHLKISEIMQVDPTTKKFKYPGAAQIMHNGIGIYSFTYSDGKKYCAYIKADNALGITAFSSMIYGRPHNHQQEFVSIGDKIIEDDVEIVEEVQHYVKRGETPEEDTVEQRVVKKEKKNQIEKIRLSEEVIECHEHVDFFEGKSMVNGESLTPFFLSRKEVFEYIGKNYEELAKNDKPEEGIYPLSAVQVIYHT